MENALIDLLPPVQRLALAYAPARAKSAWLALLALDARLGQQLRAGREPILTQIRLAWWRDRLREPASAWPSGEPLLAALAEWRGEHGRLGELVDGWEMLLGEAPLAPSALEGFVAGRAAAMQALAQVLDRPHPATHRAGAGWAIADLATHLSQPEERAAAKTLAERHDWRLPRLPRALRPLAVLHGLGARAVARDDHAAAHGRGDFVVAMRLGLLGV